MNAWRLARLALATVPAVARYRSRRAGRFAAPFALSFLVTNRCGLRCAHCFNHRALDSPSGDELSPAEYARLSASLGDFVLGMFCGGEPFARADLAEIVHALRAGSGVPLACVSTNGQRTASVVGQTEAMLRDAPSKPILLTFSLDGFRETHDRIRGAGTFERALRTWRECARLAAHHPNLLLTVATVVSTLNEEEAPRFVRWVKTALRPEAASVMLVRQSPRAGDALKQVAPESYVATVRAARERGPAPRWPDLGDRVQGAVTQAVAGTLTTGRRAFFCHAGRHGALVDHKGDVSVCEVLAEQADAGPIGNLRDQGLDFAALWNGERAARARALVNRHPCCRACTHETTGLLPSLPFAPNRPALARRVA